MQWGPCVSYVPAQVLNGRVPQVLQYLGHAGPVTAVTGGEAVIRLGVVRHGDGEHTRFGRLLTGSRRTAVLIEFIQDR